ncbi:uncharacterized protein LOC143462709 [Clavelina lepadiformis]|uniref:Uncharacterized protein n=1 Tax=Clavelina lepadiformis TaxID=159417 RepID=A0ABP0GEY7_CLALP
MEGVLSILTKDDALKNNMELLQQVALRNYMVNGEESKPFYNLVTSGRIVNELFQRVSGQRKITEYKKQCITNIIQYIRDNPKASSSAIQKEVENQVAQFAIKVSAL